MAAVCSCTRIASTSSFTHVQSSKPGCAGSRTRLLLPTKLPWADARAPLTQCAKSRLIRGPRPWKQCQFRTGRPTFGPSSPLPLVTQPEIDTPALHVLAEFHITAAITKPPCIANYNRCADANLRISSHTFGNRGEYSFVQIVRPEWGALRVYCLS